MLGGGHFIARVQDEARRGGTDQFFTRRAKGIVESWNRQIQNSLQAALDRKNQIGVTRNGLQLAIGCREEGFIAKFAGHTVEL